MQKYNCGTIYQQTRGDQISMPLLSNVGSLELGNISQCLSDAAHIVGKINILADHLSRVKIRQTEWM